MWVSAYTTDISKIKVNDFETNKFFICSDGVSNIVSNKELEEILNYADLEQMKIQIVKLIKQRGAPDDYSFIILEKFRWSEEEYKIIKLFHCLVLAVWVPFTKFMILFLKDIFALKIINVNSIPNPRFIERFKREARNQANLSHPNIVSVYGFVQEKDILGIVMEYIHGQTIENIIGKNGRFDLYYATELLEQILNGIEAIS